MRPGPPRQRRIASLDPIERGPTRTEASLRREEPRPDRNPAAHATSPEPARQVRSPAEQAEGIDGSRPHREGGRDRPMRPRTRRRSALDL